MANHFINISKKYNLVHIVKFIFIISVCILVHNWFDPPDWVDLHLEQVPPEVDAIYVVANDRGEISPLNWYSSKVITHLDSAKDAGELWNRNYWGDRRRGDVQWRSNASYGILARLKSGEWVVWWLNPGDVRKPSPFRYVTGGGVEATIRVSGIQTATPAPKSLTEQVKP